MAVAVAAAVASSVATDVSAAACRSLFLLLPSINMVAVFAVAAAKWRAKPVGSQLLGCASHVLNLTNLCCAQ